MRAAPVFQVALRRQGIWHAAVLALLGAALVAIAAWCLNHERPLPTWTPWVAGGLAAGALALGASLFRVPLADLHWDGADWRLALGAGASRSGDLRVMLDLGPWMLLRFRPHASRARRRATWLPAQRAGLEDRWHALRCAVHSPRPVAASDQTPGPAAAGTPRRP